MKMTMNKTLFSPWLYGITEEKWAELAPLEPKDALKKLISEGYSITHQANLGQVLDELELSPLRDRYLVWRGEVKKFTCVLVLPSKWVSFFAEGTAITTGSLWDYRNSHDAAFKKLVGDIKDEASMGLKNLRELDAELFGQKKLAVQKVEPIIPLPERTEWEHVEIKFEDEQGLEVYAHGHFVRRANYKELLFSKNPKHPKPNRLWEFLVQLSVAQNREVLSESGYHIKVQATIGIIAESLQIKNDNCMQIKKALSGHLQDVFGIHNDPFEEYIESRGYRTRFKLTCIPAIRGDGDLDVGADLTFYDERTDKEKTLDLLRE